MNKNLKLALKIAVSTALVLVLLRKVDVFELLNLWKEFSIGLILSVLFLHFCALLIGTLRWKLFLPEQTFSRLLQFTLINVFYGMILPGQLSGEVVKAYRLGNQTGNIKKVAISVWMDKITGILGLVSLMLVGLLFSSHIFPLIFYFFVIFILLIGILSIYIFDIPILARFAEQIFNHLRPTKISRVTEFVKNILDSFREFKREQSIIFANIFLGALYQIFSILITMTFAGALSINISIIDWFWIFGIISMIQFIPISIAGLGVREVSFVGILATFSIPAVSAIALSFSIFGIQLLFASLGFLVETHYNLSQS